MTGFELIQQLASVKQALSDNDMPLAMRTAQLNDFFLNVTEQSITGMLSGLVEWKTMEAGKPDVEIGGRRTFWICYRSNRTQELHVRRAVWFNCPEGWCEPDNCELMADDGDCWWPVGWHEEFSHFEYADYYQPFSYGEIVAYAEINVPGVPLDLLGTGANA